jgi:Ca2+-binding EF-hand superfamily protein
MVVGPSEVRELVQRFDIGDNDKVRYGLFARWLCSGHKLQAVERKARAGLKALKAMGLNAEAPFLELSSSGNNNNSGRSVSGRASLSSSSSKYCSVVDFCQAVASLGLLLTEGEVRALARAYGKDNGDEDDGRHYNSHGGEGGREGGRSSHVAWRRFLDLEDGSSSLGGDQKGGGDGSEFELSLRSVDGDVAALASKFRSKARQWSNRHPGKLAEIFASSLGPGTRGQHDNDGDDGSSGSDDDDDGGGDSGSSIASESAEDSDDSSRKRSKAKTKKKKKTKKKATKKKKKPSESLKKKSSESDGSRGLGAKGFRKLLQSLGLRTGDTSDEEALMGVFVNGGGDNDESSSSRKRHHRRLAVSVEVLGDFLFVPPGDDNEDEGPWFASDEDEDEDLEEDDDEYSTMVKQRRRGGRSQRRNRQGRSSSAKRLPGSAAVASGGDESDNHHALETVGASLRRHLRPKGSSTASANQLVWSTFAKAERKKKSRSLRSARSSWNSLTGALSRAAFSRAVGTLDPTLSRKDLAALERAFLVVTDNDRSDDDDDDDDDDRSGSSEDEDESGSENDGSRSDEEDGSESGSSNYEGSGGSSSEGSKGGGKQRDRGRGRARGSKSRSRSGRRARSGSAASRLFKGIMSTGSALTSSKRGGSSRSGRKKKKRSTRRGNGDDDVCWVHFACWLDAAIPMKVLLRVRNFVEANSTELRSKDLFAHLEDAAIAAAAAAGGDEDEDDDDDYDRHRRGSSRSPGRRGSGSGGGSSSSSSSKGKGLKLRFPVSLARALRRCGLPLSEPCAGALFTQLDRKAKGWVAVADAHAAFMGNGATLALEEAGGGGAAAGQRGDGGGGEDWMEEWLLELRASLEDSFELIWQHFDGDHNGELDRDEMDDLCHQMIKAVDPRSEPTKHQVRDVKTRIGAGGSSTGGGGRDGGRSRSKGRGGSGGGGSGGVDKETLRVGLVDYVEDEFRERLAQGNLTNGEATWQDMAGLFSAFDGNSDGCVSVAEFKYVLSHKMALLTVQEATALAACADANRDGSVSLGELKALVASAKLDTQLDGRDNGSGGRRRDSGRRTSRSRDRRSSSRDRGGSSSRRHSSSPSKLTTAKRMAATTTAYTSTNSATSRLAEYMSRRLTPLATSAVLKLKVGFVPRPEDYLSLAALGGNQGNTSLVSSVCRPSVLAKLDNFPKGKLGSAISGRLAMRRV